MNLDIIQKLSIADLMALRVAVNNRAAEVEAEAMKQLRDGEEVPHFTLKKGKVSRYIPDEDKFVKTLAKHVNEKDLFIKKPIGITAATTLLKVQTDFNIEEIEEVLGSVTDKKAAATKLVYQP